MKEEIKFYVSYHDVMGYFAKNAVQASPYPCPENLALVLHKVSQRLKAFFGDMVLACKDMTYQEMEDFFMEGLVKKIPECEAWNNRVNGREGNGYASRFDTPAADDDFVDLHAFVRNIAQDIILSQYNGDSIPAILNGTATKRRTP